MIFKNQKIMNIKSIDAICHFVSYVLLNFNIMSSRVVMSSYLNDFEYRHLKSINILLLNLEFTSCLLWNTKKTLWKDISFTNDFSRAFSLFALNLSFYSLSRIYNENQSTGNNNSMYLVACCTTDLYSWNSLLSR